MSFLRDFQQLSRTSTTRIHRLFSRLDPRQPGLLSPDLLRPGDRIRFSHKAVCCARCCLSDPGISSAGGFDFRHARRSLWASPGADPQYSWLLGHRTRVRLCTLIERVARAACAVWHCHGWGVGRRRGAYVSKPSPKRAAAHFPGFCRRAMRWDRSSRPLPSRSFSR